MAKQTITYIPQVLDLLLYAGDGAEFRLVVTDATSVPVNLTGSMRAQVRVTHEAADPPIADFDINLDDAAQGIAVLLLSGDKTQALVTTEERFIGVWDLEWTPTDGEPMTLCQGSVECAPDVSR